MGDVENSHVVANKGLRHRGPRAVLPTIQLYLREGTLAKAGHVSEVDSQSLGPIYRHQAHDYSVGQGTVKVLVQLAIGRDRLTLWGESRGSLAQGVLVDRDNGLCVQRCTNLASSQNAWMSMGCPTVPYSL